MDSRYTTELTGPNIGTTTGEDFHIRVVGVERRRPWPKPIEPLPQQTLDRIMRKTAIPSKGYVEWEDSDFLPIDFARNGIRAWEAPIVIYHSVHRIARATLAFRTSRSTDAYTSYNEQWDGLRPFRSLKSIERQKPRDHSVID